MEKIVLLFISTSGHTGEVQDYNRVSQLHESERKIKFMRDAREREGGSGLMFMQQFLIKSNNNLVGERVQNFLSECLNTFTQSCFSFFSGSPQSCRRPFIPPPAFLLE